MFVYRLSEPIDSFDGLTPLNDWLADQHPSRTAWALLAVLALADATSEVGWRGDMRHLPMVGGLPACGSTRLYLVVKQDNNGDTFVITPVAADWIDEHAVVVQVAPRQIGAWTPNEDDGPDEPAF